MTQWVAAADFLKDALAAGALAAVACGIVGSLVVAKRLVMLGGGVSHAAFGGVGLAYWLGWPPVATASGFGFSTAWIVGALTRRGKVREDAAIGAWWACGMSLGVLFLRWAPGYAPDASAFLFGNILAVTPADFWAMAALDLALIAAVTLFYPLIVSVSFDEEYSRSRGLPVWIIDIGILAAVSLAVVVLMKVVGILLVMALLTLPASSAGKFTRTLSGMIVGAVLLSLTGMGIGIFVSFALDWPTGASVVLVQTLLFLVCLCAERIWAATRRN